MNFFNRLMILENQVLEGKSWGKYQNSSLLKKFSLHNPPLSNKGHELELTPSPAPKALLDSIIAYVVGVSRHATASAQRMPPDCTCSPIAPDDSIIVYKNCR